MWVDRKDNDRLLLENNSKTGEHMSESLRPIGRFQQKTLKLRVTTVIDQTVVSVAEALRQAGYSSPGDILQAGRYIGEQEQQRRAN
jgi:hypothetical protein